MKRYFDVLITLLCSLSLVITTACAEGQGVQPGYTKEEPGHWELTDTLYVDATQPRRQDGEVTITAGWEETDMLFTFTASDGSQTCWTVSLLNIPTFCYAGFASVDVDITRDTDEAHSVGGVICSLVMADVESGAGEYGLKVTPRSGFRTMSGEEMETFDIHRYMETYGDTTEMRYSLFGAHGDLPVGSEDGETIYLVLGVMDSLGGKSRMYIACRYTWVNQPETIVVPDQYGPIEYGPEDMALEFAKLAALIAVPVAVIVLAAVRIVRRHKRGKK